MAFALGIVATLVRSELKLPEALYDGLAIDLLLAVGLKGGASLAEHGFGSVLPDSPARLG